MEWLGRPTHWKNIANAMDLLEEIQTHVVLGDAAMGTQLLAAGIPSGCCLEELCVSRPELVLGIHEQSIAAGARVIRTNSFGANSARLGSFGQERRVGELNWAAAQLARSAAKGKGVLVAGSVGPLGSAALPGIRKRFFEDQIGALLDGGAQLILLETFQVLEEILAAVEVKHTLHHCPVVCCLACDDDGRFSDGTTLATAFATLREAGADVIGVNCTSHPEALPSLFEGCEFGTPFAAFPNAGLQHELTPAGFAGIGLALIDRGVSLVGGCCGTTAAHIAALAGALSERRV
jgi:homocysteine S-methyltransferase